jgi:hypothetical protein
MMSGGACTRSKSCCAGYRIETAQDPQLKNTNIFDVFATRA